VTRRLDVFGKSFGLLYPQRIGVPVILSVQFGEENITSRFRVAQIERYGQFGLIADDTGIPCGIGDAVRTFAARDDDDGVRSGFAEARQDQIDVQQGRGEIEWRFGWLLLGSAEGSVIGEIEGSIDSGGRLLAGRWIRNEETLAIPVFGNDKPDNKACSAQASDDGPTCRSRTAHGNHRAELSESGQAMATGSHMLHS